MKMISTKIENIAQVIAGQSPSSETYNQVGTGLPFFQGKTDFGEKYPEKRIWCSLPLKIAEPNDILLSVRAPVGPVNMCKERSCIGRGLSAIRVNENISNEYLYYYLKSNQKKIAGRSTGSTFEAITQKEIKDFSVLIPEKYEEQIQIATVLSKAENLIAKRKQSIELLDDFVKSTFLQMFGDPVRNEKGWEKKKLGEFIGFLTSGSRGWAEYYSEKGDIFLRINNVKDAKLRLDDIVYVKAPNTAEANRTRVQKNDLLFSITADLGRTAVVPEYLSGSYINQHLALIRLKEEKLNPIFVAWFYSMPFGKAIVQKKNREGVKAGLNFDDIRGFDIQLPPLSLQNQFAEIVNKVEVLKAKYQKSLEELENLYASLSQRAFRGELSLNTELKIKDKSSIPEKKRGFAKQVLGGKIVSLFKDDENFSNIKFQKLQYLAEHLAEEELLPNYYKEAAGPYDNRFMHTVFNHLEKNKWFEPQNLKFRPMEKVEDIDKYFQRFFGEKSDKLSNLFNLLRRASEKFCEAVATIYAVWNNHIIQGLEFDKNKIKKEFFEWSKRKKVVFTEEEFEKALEWMQKHQIIPTGFGKLIKEKK